MIKVWEKNSHRLKTESYQQVCETTAIPSVAILSTIKDQNYLPYT